MTLKSVGVVGTIDQLHWSQIMQVVGDMRNSLGVRFGMAVTASSGRTLAIGPGGCLTAGVYNVAGSESTYSITIDANTSTNPRIDLVCVQVDWAAATDAYNNTAGSVDAKSAAASVAAPSFVVVKGVAAVTPSTPATTKSGGVLWQQELAKITVRPGVTTIASTDILDMRPVTPEKTCSGTLTLNPAGTSPGPYADTVDVSFPIRFFGTTPRVIICPTVGASTATVSNYAVSNVTASGFTASINRTTTTTVPFYWIASGV